MKKLGQYAVLDTIEKCNAYFGIDVSHPMVSIVDLSQVKSIDIQSAQLNLYAVVCTLPERGRATSDSDLVGRVKFFAPGHISHSYTCDTLDIKGWILIFHPDLLIDTLLAQRVSEYSFFDNAANGIWLTRNETQVINSCILSMREELRNDTDRYSRRILVAGIAVLLSLCMRYAERNPEINSVSNNNIVARLNTLLSYYVSLPADGKEIPSVADCARELQISPNYLGDLVRKQAGCSARDLIQKFIINEVKQRLMRSEQTISEIAYNIGFKYPHHLTRIFKRIEGITPLEYRDIYKQNW
ncbi:MAG: helix-turn-helix transcriptional regulator [Alistipes sp.]|nr:helix-turn-helix transcriptional regulator [Alistipes sp.]